MRKILEDECDEESLKVLPKVVDCVRKNVSDLTSHYVVNLYSLNFGYFLVYFVFRRFVYFAMS